MAESGALIGRLLEKIAVGEPSEFAPGLGPCWLWTAALQSSGYAAIAVKRTSRVAHLVLYEHIVGPVPDGLELDHLCRVRRCVNPDHLEPVTTGENRRRGLMGDLRPPRNLMLDESDLTELSELAAEIRTFEQETMPRLRESFHDKIRAARGQGRTVIQIAAATGYSDQRVYQIVRAARGTSG